MRAEQIPRNQHAKEHGFCSQPSRHLRMMIRSGLGHSGACRPDGTALNAAQIGHAGTLDPLATGLLIVCTGKGTKSVENFMAQEKVRQC